MKRNNHEAVSYHHLIRGIVLIGLTLLVFKLLVTNNIAFFIAPQMVRFIYFSFIVLLILSIILILRGTSEKKRYSCIVTESIPTLHLFLKVLCFMGYLSSLLQQDSYFQTMFLTAQWQ